MLFDTHAHYDAEQFDDDRDALLASLPDHNVGFVIDPGCSVESSRQAVALAQRHAHVYAAVGIHPEDCAGVTDADFAAIRQLAAEPKVVAIGEIGLDYYWVKDDAGRAFQREVLRRQMALAQQLSLPVIFHDREAHADCLSIVEEFPAVTGVFHCYSGSVEEAKILLKRGWMFGFNGAATYKNARKAPEVLRFLPLDRIFLETDAPYLTPVPYRGKRNSSLYIHLVAEKIAEYRGITPAEVESAATENALRFFHIEKR